MSDVPSNDPFDTPLNKRSHDRFERHIFGDAFPYPDTPAPSNPGDAGDVGKTGVPADSGHIHPREAATTVTQPVAIVAMFAGAVPPTGWLFCDGQAVSRSTYEALFNVIGTTFGIGDGSTTFNLPNLQAKFPLGSDGATYALGATGGAFSKNHDHAHDHGGSSNNAGAHDHTGVTGNNSNTQEVQFGLGETVAAEPHTHSISSQAAHQHGITSDNASGSVDVTPPYLVLNYIIKT